MLNRLSSYTLATLFALLWIAGQAFAQQPGEMEIRQGVIEQGGESPGGAGALSRARS